MQTDWNKNLKKTKCLNELSNLTFVNGISSTYKGGKTKTKLLADAPSSLYLKNIFDTLTAFSYTLKCNNYAIADIGAIPIFLGEAYTKVKDIPIFSAKGYTNFKNTPIFSLKSCTNVKNTPIF